MDEVPVPELGPGQVQVRPAATVVNFTDIGRRSGIYPVAAFPAMLGLERAHIV